MLKSTEGGRTQKHTIPRKLSISISATPEISVGEELDCPPIVVVNALAPLVGKENVSAKAWNSLVKYCR